MNTNEIQQQLTDVQDAGLRMDERISNLENKEHKTVDLVIPDYSIELNTIISELRNYNKNEEVNQLLSMVTSIHEKLKQQPVPINRQWRILLFPETNHGQYYKIVFGRLIPWAVCFITATYIFIAGYKAIGIYRYNQDVSQSAHYERAWHYLEQNSKKKTLSIMENAYKKTDSN